jgi:hypothetical protein
VLLDAESDKLYSEQNEIAIKLQAIIGGKRRLNDEQLNAVRNDKTASDAAVRLSLDYHELGVKIEKRVEVIARKKSLIAKLKVLVQGNRGIMKDNMDAALYHALKSKKGGLTDEQRLQRKWLLIDDEPVAEPVYVGAGAGASAAPAAPAAPAPADVKLTKNGEPDRRCKQPTSAYAVDK